MLNGEPVISIGGQNYSSTIILADTRTLKVCMLGWVKQDLWGLGAES